jgi:hypothetical protein
MAQHFDVDLIKSQIDIVDLISKDEPLQKSGDTYRSRHKKTTRKNGLDAVQLINDLPSVMSSFALQLGDRGGHR